MLRQIGRAMRYATNAARPAEIPGPATTSASSRPWRRIRTNNPLERILREIRRRTRLVGAFPDGQSALNLAAGCATSPALLGRPNAI